MNGSRSRQLARRPFAGGPSSRAFAGIDPSAWAPKALPVQPDPTDGVPFGHPVLALPAELQDAKDPALEDDSWFAGELDRPERD